MDGDRRRRGTAIEALLQDAGVPAAVAVRAVRAGGRRAAVGPRLLPDPRARRGRRPSVPGADRAASHATPAVIERPAPSYGQHTDEVLRDLLGLGDDEIAALHAAGVTSTEPLAQDWR